MLRAFTAAAAVAPVVNGAPPAVDVVRRTGPGGSYLIICNLGADEAFVPLPGSGRDLLSGRLLSSGLSRPAAGVAVIREAAR